MTTTETKSLTTAEFARALADAENKLNQCREETKAAKANLHALESAKIDLAPLQKAVDQANEPDALKAAIDKITAAMTANAVAHLKAEKEREPLKDQLKLAQEAETVAMREVETADQAFRVSRLKILRLEKERMDAEYRKTSKAFIQASAQYLAVAHAEHIARVPVGTVVCNGEESPSGECGVSVDFGGIVLNWNLFNKLIEEFSDKVAAEICAGRPPKLSLASAAI